MCHRAKRQAERHSPRLQGPLVRPGDAWNHDPTRQPITEWMPDGLFGMCVAQVDVQDEGHRFADIYSGECGHLRSATDGGALILWKAGEEGVVWAVVVLRGIADLPLLTVDDDWDSNETGPLAPCLGWVETEDGIRKLAVLIGQSQQPPGQLPSPLHYDDSGCLILAIKEASGLRDDDKDGLYVEPADFAGDGLDGTQWKLKVNTMGSPDLFDTGGGTKAIDLTGNTSAPVAVTFGSLTRQGFCQMKEGVFPLLPAGK